MCRFIRDECNPQKQSFFGMFCLGSANHFAIQPLALRDTKSLEDNQNSCQ
jgi:hypothetical protein